MSTKNKINGDVNPHVRKELAVAIQELQEKHGVTFHITSGYRDTDNPNYASFSSHSHASAIDLNTKNNASFLKFCFGNQFDPNTFDQSTDMTNWELTPEADVFFRKHNLRLADERYRDNGKQTHFDLAINTRIGNDQQSVDNNKETVDQDYGKYDKKGRQTKFKHKGTPFKVTYWGQEGDAFTENAYNTSDEFKNNIEQDFSNAPPTNNDLVDLTGGGDLNTKGKTKGVVSVDNISTYDLETTEYNFDSETNTFTRPEVNPIQIFTDQGYSEEDVRILMDIYDEQPDEETKKEILENKEVRDRELELLKQQREEDAAALDVNQNQIPDVIETKEESPMGPQERPVEEVENLQIEDGLFTGTIDPNSRQPIEGKMVFDDGDIYQGSFTEGGDFDEGYYLDFDEEQGNFELEGKWDRGLFNGTRTNMETGEETTGEHEIVDGNWKLTPVGEEENQEKIDAEQIIKNTQIINAPPPEKPKRTDYPLDPDTPSRGRVNPETEGMSYNEALKKYNDELEVYNETKNKAKKSNEEIEQKENETTDQVTTDNENRNVITENDTNNEFLTNELNEIAAEEGSNQRLENNEVVTTDTKKDKKQTKNNTEKRQNWSRNNPRPRKPIRGVNFPLVGNKDGQTFEEATQQYETDLKNWNDKKNKFNQEIQDDNLAVIANDEEVKEYENSLAGKVKKYLDDRKNNKSYRHSAINTWEIPEEEAKRIIKETRKKDHNGKTFDQLSPKEQSEAMNIAFMSYEVNNSNLPKNERKELVKRYSGITDTELIENVNNLKNNRSVYTEDGKIDEDLKIFDNHHGVGNLSQYEDGELIVIGDGNFEYSGVDRVHVEPSEGPVETGGIGETGNTFYIVKTINGEKTLVAYDPVTEKEIKGTHDYEFQMEGDFDYAERYNGEEYNNILGGGRYRNYTQDDLNQINQAEDFRLREYVDRNGYSEEFYEILRNQRYIQNPHKPGTAQHRMWEEKKADGGFVYDEKNDNWIEHKLITKDVGGDYFDNDNNPNNDPSATQYVSGTEGVYDSESLTPEGLENLGILKNNPFNPDNPDLTRKQRKKEQIKYDAWNKQAVLRGDDGQILYQWNPQTKAFGNPITSDTSFTELGYKPGQYTNTRGDKITVDNNGRAFIERKLTETADGIEYADAEEMLPTGDEWQNLEFIKGKGFNLKETLKDPVVASSLIQTVIGGIGLGQALKKTDPMQMPELSSAFEERLRQSEDLARQGFSPAEEAKVRQDINKAYKIGIDNLVRGTAGDRAKFLAGTGVLDAQRSSALLEFAAADADQQRKNRQEYTELLNYKENFEAQKTLTERTEDLNQQIANKQAGAELAANAFSAVRDNIEGGKMRKFMSQYQDMMEDSLFGPKGAGVVENIFENLLKEKEE